MVLAGGAINLGLGRLAAVAGLPLFLDSGGTVVSAALAGWPAGVGVALVTALAHALSGSASWVAVAPLQLVIAAYAAVAARAGTFGRLGHVVPAGAGLGIVLVLVAVPLISLGGLGAPPASGAGALMGTVGPRSLRGELAVLGAGAVVEIVDKAVIFLGVSLALRRLPVRLLARFPLAGRAIGEA